MAKLRLFYAVSLPDAALAALAALRAELAAEAPRHARFVAPESLHVTLKFLGTLPETALPAAEALLRRAAESAHPIPTALTGLTGYGSPRRARVLVAELADTSGALGALFEALDAGAESWAVAREERAYRPHVTLARLNPPADVRALARPFDPPTPFVLDRVRLYRSELRGQGRGSRYHGLAEVALE